MVEDLHKKLHKLNEIVDPEHAKKSDQLLVDSLTYKKVDRLPVFKAVPVKGWEVFPYAENFYDIEKMLINQLADVYYGAMLRDDRAYTIRANYGVGTVASMFGCKISLTMNNMPWCEPLSETELFDALEKGVPEMTAGLGAKVLETEKYYREVLSEYTNLKEAVKIYICDTQGPFDITHLIMGHRIYTDLYDNPDLVHKVLDLATETYIAFTRTQKEIIGEGHDFSYHTSMKVPGSVRICEDSPTNLSPSSYLEFCRPYNERILSEFGGGWIHFCGKGHQILPHILSTPGLKGVNFGNPGMQNLIAVYDEAKAKGVGIISWKSPLSSDEADHINTGITLISRV